MEGGGLDKHRNVRWIGSFNVWIWPCYASSFTSHYIHLKCSWHLGLPPPIVSCLPSPAYITHEHTWRCFILNKTINPSWWVLPTETGSSSSMSQEFTSPTLRSFNRKSEVWTWVFLHANQKLNYSTLPHPMSWVDVAAISCSCPLNWLLPVMDKQEAMARSKWRWAG